MTNGQTVSIEQAENAKNRLNFLWVYYGTPEHGVMPHGMVLRRNAKTMDEVRRFGKEPESVFYFEKIPDRCIEYAELLEYIDATEQRVRKIQEQERYNAVLKKVMAVLTDSEFELLFKGYQPRG